MSKYGPVELRVMARMALAARDKHDDRWLRLILGVALRTGLSPQDVESKIEAIAGGHSV